MTERHERHNLQSEPMCNLHMLVPVAARRHAKLAAVASGMPFREFVARLLSHARPLAAESADCAGEKPLKSGIAHIVAEPGADCVRDVGSNVVSGAMGASM